jgi:hypothetical protein
MTTKISTGLAGYMLATGSLRQAFASSFLRIYADAGSEPATADGALPPSAILLAEISVAGEGTGLTLAAIPAGSLITKNETEVWQGTALATGVAKYFRWVTGADTGAVSTTLPRVQGSVALAGAELSFSSVNFVEGAPQKVDYFVVAMPSN